MEKLTKELAEIAFAEIENLICDFSAENIFGTDHEAAHIREDNLHSKFIECLKEGMYNTVDEIKEVASIIYKTKDLDFARYCD